MSTLRRVRTGDKLRIPAGAWNACIDAAKSHLAQRENLVAALRRAAHDSAILPIKNESGADRARFDVLGVTGPLFTPTDNAEEFLERVVLRGATPAAEHAGAFAILLEPLRTNEIGRAILNGVTVARVRMVDESHQYADVYADCATELQSAGSGLARLLWIESPGERSDPAVAWTVARLGGGGGGGALSAGFALVVSRAGVLPPYRYSAVAATMDADGAWSQVPGGAAYYNVFNLEEQGTGGQWANPLNAGDAVLIFAAPDPAVDAFICARAHYRGTY